MNARKTDKRARLMQSVAKLAYLQGFNRTTLAGIAADADVPLGNVYYYFKTKEAIGHALIEQMASEVCAKHAALDQHADPKVRLEAFVQIPITNRQALAKSGCPIGSLCSEQHKDGGPLAEQATQLFAATLKWLETQFRALGKDDEARDLAVHVLSVLQGATLLTHSFGDTRYIEREAERLKLWIRSL